LTLPLAEQTIPAEHSLTAPTLLRSQALGLVYESVHRGEIDERAGRKILDDIPACGSGSSATDHSKTTLGD